MFSNKNTPTNTPIARVGPPAFAVAMLSLAQVMVLAGTFLHLLAAFSRFSQFHAVLISDAVHTRVLSTLELWAARSEVVRHDAGDPRRRKQDELLCVCVRVLHNLAEVRALRLLLMLGVRRCPIAERSRSGVGRMRPLSARWPRVGLLRSF